MGFGVVRDPLIALVWNLYQHGRAFEFRSEADIASGAEKLDAYKAIILPLGAFLDDGVDEKLLAWVNQGGLLVLLGPAGVYNKHGFVNGRLTKELVKNLPEVGETPSRGEWSWKWTGETKPKDIVRRKTGKGEILMTTVTMYPLLRKGKAFDEVLQAMEHAAPSFSGCKNRDFGLWNLADKQGCRYLGIINHNVDRDIESEITVRGEFKQVTDLDIPGEFSVPVKYSDNRTWFTVKLQPGGLTVLRLEK